jgi:predicted DNA binding CopG/RHH family protein
MAPDAAGKPEPEWDDEGLAEDVATLSYESALRSHARYSSTGNDDKILPEDRLKQAAEDIGAIRAKMASAKPTSGAKAPARAPLVPLSTYETTDPEPEPEVAARSTSAPKSAPRGKITPFERNLKKSSITIRMSEEECEQLHQRAAEAGVTVSAYLRSCTFEAEALRSQVKEVLSKLTSAEEERPTAVIAPKKPVSSATEQVQEAASSASGLGWLKKLMPQGRQHNQGMRA